MGEVSADSFGIPSDEIWKSYIILPKFGAIVSMVSSSFLARDIIIKWREKKTIRLNDIILLGISGMNIIGSFLGWFMTSWMVPKGDAPFATGNQATCDAQGFFVTVSYIYFVTAYTELAALYWLIVQRSWKDDFMNRTTIRLLFVLPPIIISLVLGIIPLFYGTYNIATQYCYIAPYPPNCVGDPLVDCIRGENAREEQTWQFAYAMACNIAIIIFMSLLVHSVYVQERRGDRYLAAGQSGNRVHTNKSARQGAKYVGAYTASYIVVYMFIVWNATNKSRGTGFTVIFYVHLIMNPLLGFFNALVYFSPRYGSYKEQHQEKSRMDCICHVLSIQAPRCRVKLCWNCFRPDSVESGLASPLIAEEKDGEE